MINSIIFQQSKDRINDWFFYESQEKAIQEGWNLVLIEMKYILEQDRHLAFQNSKSNHFFQCTKSGQEIIINIIPYGSKRKEKKIKKGHITVKCTQIYDNYNSTFSDLQIEQIKPTETIEITITNQVSTTSRI